MSYFPPDQDYQLTDQPPATGYEPTRFRPFDPTQGRRFDGFADGRRLPDADMPTEDICGVLDDSTEGHGLVRPKIMPSDHDAYISTSQIRRFWLRSGDLVCGPARSPKENERFWGLLKVESVNGKPAEDPSIRTRPWFDRLTPIYPNKRLTLETGKDVLSTRVIDLAAPIGMGQRGMIVSPPKAGKTTVLKDIMTGVAANFPQVTIIAVLIGERPEEVTDIKRHLETITQDTKAKGQGPKAKGDTDPNTLSPESALSPQPLALSPNSPHHFVAASNFDERAEEQTIVAELALEYAKRVAEIGGDVVIVLDSITRLARAYNQTVPTSGKILSGGVDSNALHKPKRFFGAARNIEQGGSLTIIATALVDTGSRMDEVIFEEFKGTGNMEINLDRRMSDRRLFPAINIKKSGTRKEELLLTEEELQKIWVLRKVISPMDDLEIMELLIDKMMKSRNNEAFLKMMNTPVGD